MYKDFFYPVHFFELFHSYFTYHSRNLRSIVSHRSGFYSDYLHILVSFIPKIQIQSAGYTLQLLQEFQVIFLRPAQVRGTRYEDPCQSFIAFFSRGLLDLVNFFLSILNILCMIIVYSLYQLSFHRHRNYSFIANSTTRY